MRKITVFGVQCKSLSAVLNALELPNISMAYIQGRYGSVEEYIRNKNPGKTDKELANRLTVIQESTKMETIISTLDQALTYYINSQDKPADPIRDKAAEILIRKIRCGGLLKLLDNANRNKSDL